MSITAVLSVAIAIIVIAVLTLVGGFVWLSITDGPRFAAAVIAQTTGRLLACVAIVALAVAVLSWLPATPN